MGSIIRSESERHKRPSDDDVTSKLFASKCSKSIHVESSEGRLLEG